MIEPSMTSELESEILKNLQKLKPKPAGAPSDYDKAQQDFAKAIAEAVAKIVIKTVKGAEIIAPGGGGPCLIS
jgi:hypothetical protein